MKPHPPILYHYLKKYQDDPSSRVFAPLAEAYRKAGLVQEALEIARDGVKLHPRFVGGKVALARTLFDLKKYDEVVGTLSEVIQEAPDNLVAQRIFAESSLMLGQVAEALSSYKMLLYFNPSDEEIARMVSELESQAYEAGALVLRSDLGSEAEAGDADIANFQEAAVGQVLSGDPRVQMQKWMKKIEFLQSLLARLASLKARTQ